MQSFNAHVLADGNQRVWIRETMLEFSSTVLSTLSSYPLLSQENSKCATFVRRNGDTIILSCDTTGRLTKQSFSMPVRNRQHSTHLILIRIISVGQ